MIVKRGLALALLLVILVLGVVLLGCVFGKAPTNHYLRRSGELEIIATPIQKTIVYTCSEEIGEK